YLKSPIDPATSQEIGISLFSNTLNAATGFPDPVGVVQLWRYLSGNASPSKGDNPCTFPNPKQRKLCFLFQQPEDTRFFQASGPFSLAAGRSATIVVAYVHGAPVASKLLGGKIGGDVKPGIPPTGVEIAADPTLVRAIDSIAGWVTQVDRNGNGAIDQDEVTVVQRSLLDKALVAQAVFDTKFLLPFAPEPPAFHLVPGDNEVSIVWTRSTTETTGDPYFSVASDPTNTALYDPNFRKIDVEGYRIYRGRTTAQLELVAQFDYDGTTFTDRNGTIIFSPGVDYGNRCAPELGIQTTCPVNFNAGQSEPHDVASPLVQIKPGDRVQLANGTIFNIRTDTALTGAGFPELENTGVPFAFVDKSVRNSFTYYYAITAFDVNSLKSGPSSLESARITKSVIPRAPTPSQVAATLISGLFGDDNTQLDPRAPWSIDPNTGRFSGAPPATDALSAVFAPLVPALLPALNLTAKVDSLVPHSDAETPSCGANSNALGACYEVFITFNKDGQVTPFRQRVYWPVWSAFGEPNETELALGSFNIPADAAAAQRFGIPANFSTFQAKVGATLHQYIAFSAFEGQAARRAGIVGIPNMGGGAGVSPGGSRWFEGANESVDHPGYSIRVGKLPGTDTVWAPIHHTDTDPNTPAVQQYPESSPMQCFGYILGGLAREADVQFTWGSGGAISAVRDLTHHANVPFKTGPQSSYGFIDDFNANGRIDWRDFNYLETISPAADDVNGVLGFCGHTDPGAGARGQLLQQPKIMEVTTRSNIAAEAGSNGFGLYVNGERYIFRLTGGNAPASGTRWTVRTYAGYVRASSGAATTAPGGYTLISRPRPPLIPNLQVVFKVDKATELAEETDSTLMKVHTVPDPYYVTTSLEATTNTKILKFVNLPAKAVIRIYSVSGILVQVLEHNDVTYGGEETWNLRSRNNQFVASGVYFYHVESPSGRSKIGRFTVVNFAQ
ncbi:MAG: hypothetical protein HY560_13615, partial [Gemmatimonadetes bacterium]|nr:hypothetical protein [Gemmatimonadota bacterium]